MEDRKEVQNLKLRIKYFGFSLVIGTFRAVSKFSFKFENIKELVSRCYYYFKIWLLMSKNSFIVMLEQKKFLFREVYRFRPLLVSGDFDLVMTKPMNALFRVLMGGADVIDFITIPPLLIVLAIVGGGLNPNFFQIFSYLIFIINSLMIAAAFHILVLAFGIITLEIDHVIWIYRDLTNLGRFPVDIYRQPIQGILTYLIPVGIMMTFPVKAMLGLISSWGILFSFSLGILMVILSIKLWNRALKSYTSASS